ncbi:hypothetical protein MKW94_001859 [Papaver nudicaule]|uniref:Possible tRNA binding domain-containing protein n=1 Tax=Papaver nudicaule TaxID=74823 RepID=A0AA41VZT7_PAPNU|nr:hypothetical protein [Papaver nudicaule]
MINYTDSEPAAENGFITSLNGIFSPHDIKRLEAYTSHLTEFHMILDLLPIIAHQYFQEKFPVQLSYVQASILLCMGLQNQNVTCIAEQLKLTREQILSDFIKVMKRFYKYLHNVAANEIELTLPRLKKVEMLPHDISLDDDLNDAAKQVKDKMKAEGEGSLDPQFLQQYAIVDKEAAFEEALKNGAGKIGAGGVISLKSTKQKKEKKEKDGKEKESDKSSSKKRGKGGDSGSRSHKKKKN